MFAPVAVRMLPLAVMKTSRPAPIDLLIVTDLDASMIRSTLPWTPPAEFSLWLIVLLIVMLSPRIATMFVVVMLDGSVPTVSASMMTSPLAPVLVGKHPS